MVRVVGVQGLSVDDLIHSSGAFRLLLKNVFWGMIFFLITNINR